MSTLLSRSILVFTLFSCLFILPACDSSGSNEDGEDSGGGGGGNDDVVQASDQNRFALDFTPPSSSASKDSETVEGFAFAASGTLNGTDAYAIYFSSKKTFDSEEVSSSSGGPATAGVILVLGQQNPDGSVPIVDIQSNQETSEAVGVIVKGFDNPPEEGTRTLQLFKDGSIEFADGNVTGFSSVQATELFVDFSEEESENRFTEVSVNLNGTIDPAEGVSELIEKQTFLDALD